MQVNYEQERSVALISPEDCSTDIRIQVRQSLWENYSLQVELVRLPGENLNFLAQVSKDEKYVVKIAADDQPPAFVEMEYLALKLARESLQDLALPQILENKHGKIETCLTTSENSSKRLRVIDYIQGVLLEGSDISEPILRNVGSALAQFDLALRDFDHPAAHRKHRWDLTKAQQYQNSLELVQEPQKRKILAWAFDQYKKLIAGKFDQVKWQFIHGDANPENILLEGDRVVGLLDFGDACHNPRACELAICLPYLMMDRDEPMATVGPVIEAYDSVCPLSTLERELLWPLMLGRIATTVSVATFRRQLDPNHPNWFVSEARAWRLLEQLHGLPTPRL